MTSGFRIVRDNDHGCTLCYQPSDVRPVTNIQKRFDLSGVR